ncbi:Rrf2 family transcriptional regulator [Fortiea sp. LEGE XX443]|nr:Rrf2 family transcriptional regulator [Fortiea sp. LEGE XX443]
MRLDHLLKTLRCGGLIQSIRDANNGYTLVRQSKQITVLNVYRCVEF